MHTQIRKLTEGAITVAIIGMILIINRLGLGLFEQYFSWLLPLPLLVYTAKYGLKDAIIVYFSSDDVSLVKYSSICGIDLIYWDDLWTWRLSKERKSLVTKKNDLFIWHYLLFIDVSFRTIFWLRCVS